MENATSTINTSASCNAAATTTTHDHHDDYELEVEVEESDACSIISNEKRNALQEEDWVIRTLTSHIYCTTKFLFHTFFLVIQLPSTTMKYTTFSGIDS